MIFCPMSRVLGPSRSVPIYVLARIPPFPCASNVARMIAVDHLTKRYGTVVAVDGLSFGVGPGRVTGFLGPNGAGNPAPAVRVLLTSVYAPEVPGRLTLV